MKKYIVITGLLISLVALKYMMCARAGSKVGAMPQENRFALLEQSLKMPLSTNVALLIVINQILGNDIEPLVQCGLYYDPNAQQGVEEIKKGVPHIKEKIEALSPEEFAELQTLLEKIYHDFAQVYGMIA